MIYRNKEAAAKKALQLEIKKGVAHYVVELCGGYEVTDRKPAEPKNEVSSAGENGSGLATISAVGAMFGYPLMDIVNNRINKLVKRAERAARNHPNKERSTS